MFFKIGVLKMSQISQENACVGSLFNIVAGLALKFFEETPTQVFSCEICKIFKNTSFTEQTPMAVSLVTRLVKYDVCKTAVKTSLYRERNKALLHFSNNRLLS